MEAWREDVQTYLMHYGKPRRSGRYPYGSGERPFQGESPAVRRRKLSEVIKDARTHHKRKKAAAKARRAKADKKKQAEEYERNKKNPNWVKKHLGELSNEEIKQMTDRLNVESNYRDALIKKLNTGKAYADFVLGYVGTGLSAIDNYNKVAKLINGDKAEGQKQLPIIGEKRATAEAAKKKADEAQQKAAREKLAKELDEMPIEKLKDLSTRQAMADKYIKSKLGNN